MSAISMDYSSANTVAETPLGVLKVWATSAHHVGISTDRDGDGVAESVTINRVDYRLRVDVHPESYYAARKASGERHEWQSDPVDFINGWSCGRGANPITRVDWQNVSDMHGSYSAQEKARATILAWASEWLTTDDGRALLAAGQEVHDKREREALNAERATIVARLAEIDARLADLS